MKIYPMLLALCQDLGINPMNVRVSSPKSEDRISLGKTLNVKDILFGEDATEVEKLSVVVNNLFAQSESGFESGATKSGYFKNGQISIIQKIAEAYQEAVVFLMIKKIYPDMGFGVDKGLIYHTVDEETFLIRIQFFNKKIRENHKVLLDSVR